MPERASRRRPAPPQPPDEPRRGGTADGRAAWPDMRTLVPPMRLVLVTGFFASAVSMTVIVAWACVLWAPMPVLPMPKFREGLAWPWHAPSDWPAPSHQAESRNYALTFGGCVVLHEPERRGFGMYRLDAGFPWRAFVMVRTSDRVNVTGWFPSPSTPGFATPHWIPREGGRWQRDHLPVQPIWSGFALNTAANLAVLGVLWCGQRWLRRLLRRRAGVCGICGYSLAGLVGGAACPECGAVRGG